MTNIYRFTDDCEDKPLLGNKGANLVTMTRLGLRVPPGFVVSIDAFKEYRASNTLPLDEIDEALAWLSDKLGRSFDDGLTGLRTLLRARLHARHDGHRPQRR